jgi:hypothetical protein
MPTKDHKRYARGMVEALESRVHAGPPVCETEIQAAREFLRQNEFSSASDYFDRLVRIQHRIVSRPRALFQEKRNYGGEAAGYWMQVQSIYDHVILSTVHDGEFNSQRGRVKISHRFNQAGRIDFVELKFLRSLQPCLNGALRKLVTVCGYQDLQKDWHEAEAVALRVLPRELVFLCGDLFRFPKNDVLAWLINIGHWIGERLLTDLKSRPANGRAPVARDNERNPNQLNLKALLTDEVALPILEHGASLTSTVELNDAERAIVRYVHK